MLHRLERHSGDVFLSTFDPACVREIIVGPDCTVESQLRGLITDARYQHVQIKVNASFNT